MVVSRSWLKGVFIVALVLSACSPNNEAGESPRESEFDLTQARSFTQQFTELLINGDLEGAYGMTVPSFANRHSLEDFREMFNSRFEPCGVPVEFVRFDYYGVGPGELSGEIGFPSDYPVQHRAARTLATVRTTRGGADVWINIGSEDGKVGVVDFEVLPPD